MEKLREVKGFIETTADFRDSQQRNGSSQRQTQGGQPLLIFNCGSSGCIDTLEVQSFDLSRKRGYPVHRLRRKGRREHSGGGGAGIEQGVAQQG